MTNKGTNGNGLYTPAYEDKIVVANKITFFPYENRERTILLHPFVGEEGREKDFRIIEFADRLRQAPGETEMARLRHMAKDEEFYVITKMALELDNSDDSAWLDDNMTLMGWIDAFRAGIEYRMAGSVWRPDVQEALKK